MSVMVIALTILGQQSELNADQFRRIMAGLHSKIDDFSLVYEGYMEGGNPSGTRMRHRFQGAFGYRNDGATAINSYRHGEDLDGLLVHTKIAMLESGRIERVEDLPDLSVQPGRIMIEPGSSGTLNQPGSPHRFIYLWHFSAADSPELLGFEDLGWEEVDGHRCKKVRMLRYDGPNAPTATFWIDLDRGGHPLRVELRDGGKLRNLAREIQLHSFAAGGESYWLPVHGVYESYWDGDSYYREPTYREVYDVVRGSVRINEHPPDRRFTIAGMSAPPTDPGLRRLHDAMERQLAEAASRPMLRTDPAGVQQRLDEALAVAEQQAAMVEASSAARQVWGPSRYMQLGAAALGVAAIGGALLLRRRYR